MTGETLKVVKDRWEAKVEGNKSRVRKTNPFQRLSHTDKENCYYSQWKEVEENNKKGTIRNLY